MKAIAYVILIFCEKIIQFYNIVCEPMMAFRGGERTDGKDVDTLSRNFYVYISRIYR